MSGVLELAVILLPAKRGECQVLSTDGTTHEHGDIGELFALIMRKDVGTEQVTNALINGAIKNVSESAAAAMLREEKDTLEKGWFPEPRVRENKASF